ncbi:heparinase II/III domain-containing protein [Photobacterium satsumensis]|uniref:heparinase II/III domain-containing protein n=1 Tax=Photobacterium satsumensis TaxID=2910239 RepID=UPI003D10008B
MLQFSIDEMAIIKGKDCTKIIDNLILNNHTILTSDTLVPPDSRATWNLYYFCPEHGVRLEWQRNSPCAHRCPVDGKVFTGEPYDGAWWRWLNGLNSKACNELGLLWHLTGEQKYLDKVREILMGYADHYPDYEEHGGIPYNGPGKANAQTLCEANCHMDFARGYDFVREALTAEERTHIEQNLLREGAEFMMLHRSDQLHNHEMKISSTIGVIGLLLDEQRFIDFAVNSPYGLRYQLEHGIIGEGLWFEGSIHYHYYALQALMGYEMMARGSEYSLKDHPSFFQMLAFPLKLVQIDGRFPRLNDCIAGQEVLTHSHLFEYAYSEFNHPLFASVLKSIYQNKSRDNIDALLYGVDELPADAEPLITQPIHAPGVGLTLCKDDTRNNMLLLKHTPYGGEHDHYDRLGLILCRDGKEILPDLGTTGYGAELHYGYYKNTATHNTLAVNQQNQPPAIPEVLSFEQKDGVTCLDTVVDWSKAHPGLDSHTLVHWDEDAYRDVLFRRSVIWLGNAAIEINQVENPHAQQLDLIWHVRGQHQVSPLAVECVNPLDGPLARMTDCKSQSVSGVTAQQFNMNEEAPYQCFVAATGELLTGQAPDNPATSNLSYMLLRSQECSYKAAVIHDLDSQQPLDNADVQWVGDSAYISLNRGGHLQSIKVAFSANGIEYHLLPDAS